MVKLKQKKLQYSYFNSKSILKKVENDCIFMNIVIHQHKIFVSISLNIFIRV